MVGDIDAVINAAGLTNVDACETDVTTAWRLNAQLPLEIAEFCERRNIRFVQISTDQLFDGSGRYAERALPAPTNFYGMSKLAGEMGARLYAERSTVIRTNFFGFNLQPKDDFAGWICRNLEGGRTLDLFDDVEFSPVTANFLVETIFQLIQKDWSGVINVCSSDSCSKLQFGLRLAEELGLDRELIKPSRLAMAKLQARRPLRMDLDATKLGNFLGRPSPSVQDGILQYSELKRNRYQEQLRAMVV